MPDRDAGTKLRIYHAIYRLNLSFANIVVHCRALRECRILEPKDTRLYQCSAQELQADINHRLTGVLEMVESDDRVRFGKVTYAHQKELRDPDDVFLHAEARRKELARQNRKKSLKSGKTASSSAGRPSQHKPAARKGRA